MDTKQKYIATWNREEMDVVRLFDALRFHYTINVTIFNNVTSISQIVVNFESLMIYSVKSSHFLLC